MNFLSHNPYGSHGSILSLSDLRSKSTMANKERTKRHLELRSLQPTHLTDAVHDAYIALNSAHSLSDLAHPYTMKGIGFCMIVAGSVVIVFNSLRQ